MAKRGAKTTSPHLKAVAGTERLDRVTVLAFDPLGGDATLPAQFEAMRSARPQFAAVVLDIWNDQIAKYRQRGQATAGFSRALYQMCLLEAEIHEMAEQGRHIDMAMRNGLRVYYSEFFDTPSGNVKPSGTPIGNRFRDNGKRPKP